MGNFSHIEGPLKALRVSPDRAQVQSILMERRGAAAELLLKLRKALEKAGSAAPQGRRPEQ